MMLQREGRSVDLVDAEVTSKREFRGYAAVFDSPWNDKLIEETGYIEKIARGVFRKVLAKNEDVPFVLAHDRTHGLLGTTGSGAVTLKEDGKGLLVEAKLPDNYLGEYARSMIEAGDLKGMSYGYALDPRRDTVLTKSAEGIFTRTIARVEKLLDVSLTWEPAYNATTVELRSTGFVAVPLQEFASGEGSQTGEAVTGQTPDDDAGEGNEEPDADNQNRPRRFWEIVIADLERDGALTEGVRGHASRRIEGASGTESALDSGTTDEVASLRPKES